MDMEQNSPEANVKGIEAPNPRYVKTVEQLNFLLQLDLQDASKKALKTIFAIEESKLQNGSKLDDIDIIRAVKIALGLSEDDINHDETRIIVETLIEATTNSMSNAEKIETIFETLVALRQELLALLPPKPQS